ncbi:hypothetical protein IWQ62_004760 [Dispira parvispora]|uniref:Lysine--tRNA ligase n=1 Tax=Dispira parvispora TaxID=1520584 RepID=A0A9W8ARR2_9FUNG|nr:hypothetical protein IWQ62_004760 [Dispira parvispora]
MSASFTARYSRHWGFRAVISTTWTPSSLPVPWRYMKPHFRYFSHHSITKSTGTRDTLVKLTPTTSFNEGFDPQFKEQRLLELRQHAPGPLYPRIGLSNGEEHKVQYSIQTLRELWDQKTTPGEHHLQERVTVQGRIVAKRDASSKLLFLEIMDNNVSMQLVVSQRRMEEDASKAQSFKTYHKVFHKGDIVQAHGFVGKTQSGELSVFATKPLRLLAPCLHDLPYRSGLKNYERRYRQRYLDFLINPAHRQVFYTRAQVIRCLRQFLDARGFIEVETPILWPRVGGANARPFLTRGNALNRMPLQLRVAPELFLKQLVVGGMSRVYEIGKQFRNEGIDANHNPEFTTLEFYQAYTDLEGLMQLTEELLRYLVGSLKNGSTTVEVSNQLAGDPVSLEFGVPFQRLHVVTELERHLGQALPNLADPDKALGVLTARCAALNVALVPPVTLPRVLDTLITKFLEPQCVQPTFLYGHPTIMSPLAKASDTTPGTAQRFELYVLGKEIVNAYEELNDPEEQRTRFAQQLRDRGKGDDEAQLPDEEFCQALEYGLPPTGGWGMGIDRLCALLTDTKHLRDTLTFPIVKPTGL